jgi:hypothetical protein
MNHCWNPQEFTSTPVAVPFAVVVMVMAVLTADAGMHGIKLALATVPPAALELP